MSRVKKKTPFLAAPKRAWVPDFDSDEEDDGSYTRHPQLQGRGGSQIPPVKRVRVLPPVNRHTNTFLRFSCGKCSQRFAWPDYLENHIRSAHSSRARIRSATIRPAAPKPSEAIVITDSSSEEEEDDEETLAERSQQRKRSSKSARGSPPPKKINFSDVGTIMGLLNGSRA